MWIVDFEIDTGVYPLVNREFAMENHHENVYIIGELVACSLAISNYHRDPQGTV